MEMVSYPFKASSVDKDDPILLMPVGDIQWYGKDSMVALKMLRKHLAWGVENNAWFLGMGDYIDFMSPTNRSRYLQAELYDSAAEVIEQKATALNEQLYEEALKVSKGRWLGLLEGHHFFQYKANFTSDQELARMLDTRFLGTSAMVRLLFRQGTRRGPVDIWSHHGLGGGVTPAAALNKLIRISQGFQADIYLMGHVHQKVAKPLDYIVPQFGHQAGVNHRLVHRTRIVASTGSFLKGYAVGHKDGTIPRGTYVEKGMMNPVELGGIVISIAPRWVQRGRVWLPDLRVSL